MNLAFKDAELAARSGSLIGGLFSRAIKWKTGGRFSHVELWMGDAKEQAVCFSSREPEGTAYRTINLAEKVGGQDLWTCVEINATPAQMDAVRWFAEGTGLKRYDMLGILGFVLPQRTHDPAEVFCSEWCCLAMQRCLGLFLGDDNGQPIRPWTVSPSDLYDMAIKFQSGAKS